MSAMNKYGRIAKKHWTEFRPSELATLPASEEFFSTLGQQMETQILDLADKLAGKDTPGEGYLEKVGRLNAAKMQAEEIVLTETVFATVEDQDQDETNPETFAWINEVHEAIRNADQEEPTNFSL
jgi:hypothetical protein